LTYFSNEVINSFSISADGRHIVFEMRNTVRSPYESDLWLLDRLNPADTCALPPVAIE